MAPDWLGSPQHAIAGLLLGAAVVALTRRRVGSTWLLLALAVGVVALAELLVELVEYPLLYGADAHAAAYYDTVADMAATLVGGVAGACAALALGSARR
jgi:hypothetical protein